MKIKLTESEMRGLIVNAISNVKKEQEIKEANQSSEITLKESDLRSLVKSIISEAIKPNLYKVYIDMTAKTNSGIVFTIVGTFGYYPSGDSMLLDYDYKPGSYTPEQVEEIISFIGTNSDRIESILQEKLNEYEQKEHENPLDLEYNKDEDPRSEFNY